MMESKDKITLESPRYRWRYTPIQNEDIENIRKHYNYPKTIAEILVKKSLSSKSDIDTFFNMPLSSILSPFEIMNMDKATDRITKAIINKEKICIYGDYDVDGITSTAALYLFLTQLGADVIYYIPNRLEEGYGLNMDAMGDIASKAVKLIITVDCGISADNEVAKATALGIDVIITDHHQPSSNIPKDAYTIVNPIQNGDNYAFKNLSGVGVAFKLIMALRFNLRKADFFKSEPPNIKSFLDIVTLGTVADVVPLTGENRIFVKQGLSLMSGSSIRTGIDELKELAGLSNIQMRTSHVGFQLAPRINAVGRMGSSDKSLRLLITDDRLEARSLAMELDTENKYRQSIEKEIIKESFDMIESQGLMKSRCAFVLSSNGWHPGVIGIVASRVVDKYFRPTVILTKDGEFAKGSARSIPAFHLYDALDSVSDLLMSFGGHKYAAGVKIALDKIDEFTERFNDVAKKTLKDSDLTPEINIDAFLEPEEVTLGLVDWISKLEPFGAGNKEPIFCIKDVENFEPVSFVGKDNSHLKCTFKKNHVCLDAIGYNMKDCEELLTDCTRFDIVFTLTLNKWRGDTNIQLNLKDIRKACS